MNINSWFTFHFQTYSGWEHLLNSPLPRSISVQRRSGLLCIRHLNTAPGEWKELLKDEFARGAPTRILYTGTWAVTSHSPLTACVKLYSRCTYIWGKASPFNCFSCTLKTFRFENIRRIRDESRISELISSCGKQLWTLHLFFEPTLFKMIKQLTDMCRIWHTQKYTMCHIGPPHHHQILLEWLTILSTAMTLLRYWVRL